MNWVSPVAGPKVRLCAKSCPTSSGYRWWDSKPGRGGSGGSNSSGMDLWSNGGRSNAAGKDCEVRGQDRSQNTGRTAERKRNHLCGIAWTACRSHAETGKQRVPMKIVIGATGASGSIYLQRLLEQINASEHEVHLVMTVHARQVADHELMTFRLPPKVLQHPDNDMNVPFVSGSARFDAMVIVPCSMSTLGRIATGSGQGALLRAADVFLKERRK